MTIDGDKLIRGATAAVVTAVALGAAVVSYNHIYDLGRLHGGDPTASTILPLTIDGTILAMSLVMLHEARQGRRAPARAWVMLMFGILATIAANVTYGVTYGAAWAVLWALPPVSFVGAVEVLMWMIRKARPETTTESEETPADLREFGEVPSSVLEAAKASMTATLAAGNPWSVNQLVSQFSLTRAQATKVRAAVLAPTNGHAVEGDDQP